MVGGPNSICTRSNPLSQKYYLRSRRSKSTTFHTCFCVLIIFGVPEATKPVQNRRDDLREQRARGPRGDCVAGRLLTETAKRRRKTPQKSLFTKLRSVQQKPMRERLQESFLGRFRAASRHVLGSLLRSFLDPKVVAFAERQKDPKSCRKNDQKSVKHRNMYETWCF